METSDSINRNKDMLIRSVLDMESRNILDEQVRNGHEEYGHLKKSYTHKKNNDKTLPAEELDRVLADMKYQMFQLKRKNALDMMKRDYYYDNENIVINDIFENVIAQFKDEEKIGSRNYLQDIIRSNIDSFFSRNNEFFDIIQNRYDDFEEPLKNIYYIAESSDDDSIRSMAVPEEEEKQVIINQYYNNVDKEKMKFYPPHTIKEILIVNSYDDIRKLFSDDKAISEYMSLSDEKDIKLRLKKKESILYGYNEIFRINPEDIYRLPDDYRTDDNRLKTYLLINNIDQWLIQFESNDIDISDDEFDENIYQSDETGKNIEDEHLFSSETDIDMELTREDISQITEASLKYIRGYEQCIREYRMMKTTSSEQNAEYSTNDSSDTDLDIEKKLHEKVHSQDIYDNHDNENIKENQEQKDVDESDKIDVIFLDDIVICHMTPAMCYIKTDDEINAVLGVKTYDMNEYHGHQYIQVRDHYYLMYRTVRKNKRISFSMTRETASEEFLRSTFEITSIECRQENKDE